MKTQTRVILAVVALGVAVWAVGKVVGLYADYLWFDTLGYASVFGTELWTKVCLGGAVFLVTGLWLAAHTVIAGRHSPGRYIQIKGLPWVIPSPAFKRAARLGVTAAILVVAAAAALGATQHWYALLQFLHHPSFGWTDPVLGYDAAFYVFNCPVLESFRGYVMFLAVTGAAAAGLVYLVGGALAWPGEPVTRPAAIHLGALAALLLAAVGFGYWLDRFDLMLSSRGAVFGIGYIDAAVRVPVLTAMAVICAGAAALVIAGAATRRNRWIYAGIAVPIILHVLAVGMYPQALQRFKVEPNELALEEPYLLNNLTATRFAYQLDGVEVKPYSATGTLSLKDLRRITGTVENVRIWDWRVLRQTYNQIESLRPYYHFNDVDVDRYSLHGGYRQVTLAVRELDTRLLNEDSRTWVNLYLLYTHGYGLVMSPVNVVTPEGMPDLWIRNIPPQSTVGPAITQPAIYFGEVTHDPVFVHTAQQEFDYPLGNENRYTQYQGKGGVPVNSTARQWMFAYYFGDWNVLLTDSFTPETRVLWRRQVLERVRAVAPPTFAFDDDPYPVIYDGRIVWIIDTYTQTGRFPYSAPARGVRQGANYLRNPIKAVVDAYDGTVTFYLIDPSEPLAAAAREIFPALFRDGAEMPDALRAHLRYPLTMFETQAEQYLAYHMTDPRIFYNKEDLWERPRHVFDGRTTPVEAYYFIMTLPGEEHPEYLLMMPFTPARKDNMVGWLAGRCDGHEYGKTICYTFPKDHLIFGPNQVAARINQNDQISPQLTLWNQHGSRVVRGNLLVIPVGDSILYIEPLYLMSENAAIPELKRVIVSYQERIAMRSTLDEALAAVFGEGPPAATGAAPPPTEGVPAAVPNRWNRVKELFEKALQQQRAGDWAGYGQTLKELQQVINEGAAESSKR